MLVGAPQRVHVTFNPPALRREDRDVLTQFDPRRAAAAPAAQPAPRRPSSRSGPRRAR